MKIEKFHIPNEKKQEMLDEIKAFFHTEREEDLGDLAAGIILDFIIEKLGPEFYNQGVLDSYKYFNDQLPDLLEIQK